MPRPLSADAPGPLELIEEAVALLRGAPAACLLSYYVGALPFALGVLWFWVGLGVTPDAARRLPVAALGLALLFLWLKTWQALFARQLFAELCGVESGWPGLREFLRLAARQGIAQPVGLFALPLGLGLIAPFPHTCAFFQNLTVLAGRPELGAREWIRRAAREAARWPLQHCKALVALLVFGLFVFLNVFSAVALVPALLKMLLGIDTVFSRSEHTLLNYTTLLVVSLLTWLCLDPLLKAFYLVRCFHGDSLRTGQDLRAQLRRLGAATAVLAALLVSGLAAPAAHAASAPVDSSVKVEAPEPAAPALDLDRAITDTLEQPEFRWRDATDREGDPGWLLPMLDNFLAALQDAAERARLWLRDLWNKLFRWRGSPAGGEGIALTQLVLFILVVALAALITLAVIRLIRVWRPAPVAAAQPVAAVPRIELEHAHAAQLPADEWTRLAVELLGRGELRAALRALYLAQLALLADRGLLTLARFKSNRDYQRELDRRAHALPGLVAQFSDAVRLVDRVWYGRHPVDRATVERFAGSVEALRTNSPTP